VRCAGSQLRCGSGHWLGKLELSSFTIGLVTGVLLAGGLGYTVPYAVGAILPTIWGAVIVCSCSDTKEKENIMRKLALAVVLMLLSSGAAMADNDNNLQERQLDNNKNRRDRQADAIEKMDDDNKADAARRAHDRNQDVRERQKDVNKRRRD
jgi:hypothetical protein